LILRLRDQVPGVRGRGPEVRDWNVRRRELENREEERGRTREEGSK